MAYKWKKEKEIKKLHLQDGYTIIADNLNIPQSQLYCKLCKGEDIHCKGWWIFKEKKKKPKSQ